MTPHDSAPQPHQQVMQLIFGKMVSRRLTEAAELGIADLLHAGALSTSGLAKKTNTNADALYRVLRALAAVDVYSELHTRKFTKKEHTDTRRGGAPEHPPH